MKLSDVFAGLRRRGLATGLITGSLLAGWAGFASAAPDDGTLGRLDPARARPLFAPSRRPPAIPVAPAPVPRAVVVAPPAPPPSVQLSGIIVGADKQVALLKRLETPAAISVTVGSQVDGWTVSAILARSVILRRDDRSVTIGLPEPGR